MRLVCLSDTHGRHGDVAVPEGDVLIHAGDFTNMGQDIEIAMFASWLSELHHPHKVCIAGNHDWGFQLWPRLARAYLEKAGAVYLEDSGIEIQGVRFWGAPWTPPFMNWAFMLPPRQIAQKWARIPRETDVLITHGPPWSILDPGDGQAHAGCPQLFDAYARNDLNPRVHVFGHLHEGYGVHEEAAVRTKWVNAAICNDRLDPVNAPVVIDI